jgi:hypothetical protein
MPETKRPTTKYDIDDILRSAWERAVRKMVADWSALDSDTARDAIARANGEDPGEDSTIAMPMWGTVFNVTDSCDRRALSNLATPMGPPDPADASGDDDEAAFAVLEWAEGRVSAPTVRCNACGEHLELSRVPTVDTIPGEAGLLAWRTIAPEGGPFGPESARRLCAGDPTEDGEPHPEDGVREGPHTPDTTPEELFDSVREAWLESGDDDAELDRAGWQDLPGGAICLTADGEMFVGVNGAGFSFYGDRGDGMPGRPGSVWGTLYAALARGFGTGGYAWHENEAQDAILAAFARAVERMNLGDSGELMREARAFKRAMGKLGKALDAMREGR